MAALQSPIDLEPGNFTIIVGHHQARARLLRAQDDIDDWLYELTDAFAAESAERLQLYAPGGIGRLVEHAGVMETSPGNFVSSGGVHPDYLEEDIDRGRESSPADYPVYVDQGTGIYGEHRSPIDAVPGYVMGPIFYRGRNIFIHSFKGQRAQHFSDKAFRGTVDWIPTQIQLALPELERKIGT